MGEIPIGVVTISDRASAGVYEDKGGPGIEAAAARRSSVIAVAAVRRLVPDERPRIEAALCELADVERCSLILTTGGTGPSPRDVTPEATEAVCDRLMPGFGELMRTRSLLEVPTAILSRQAAGLRGRSLIVNLPGKPSAIRTCLDAVFPAIPYCLDLIEQGRSASATRPTVGAFRPGLEPRSVRGRWGRAIADDAAGFRDQAGQFGRARERDITMIYELRIYWTLPGWLPNSLARFQRARAKRRGSAARRRAARRA